MTDSVNMQPICHCPDKRCAQDLMRQLQVLNVFAADAAWAAVLSWIKGECPNKPKVGAR